MTEIDLRAEGPLFRTTGEGRTDISPRTSSVVSRACEPKPTSRTSAYVFNCERYSANRFAFSPLVPASGGASSFLPASALRCISFTESCDPEKGKARDASDQLLPPE